MKAGRLVRRLLLGATLVVVCMTPAPADSSDGVDAGDERPANADAVSVARALSAWLPHKLQTSSVPGAAWVVADRDEILSERTFGHTDGPASPEITPDTVFCIRSISKSVTTLAVLIAVQDGLLDLDTPIGIYWPEFTVHTRFAPHPERRITLRHMLSHWAGFTHDPPLGIDVDRPGYFDRYVSRISDTWLRFPVGYRHQYSNYGYDLAAHLIEIRSGMPFAEYARQKVLLPLGMTRSTFDLDRAARIEDRAIGHDRRGRVVPLRFPEIAAAGLYASARDMVRFMQFQLNGGTVDGRRLLRQDLMQEFEAIQFPAIGQRTGYAMGWIREVVSDTFSLYHEGGGRGFGSHLILYPELGFGVVLLTNREYNGLTGYAGRVVMNAPIVDRYGDLLVADARLTRMDPVASDDPRVKAILGRYGDSPGVVLGVEEKVLGLRMADVRFVPVSLYDDGGQLVAMYEGVKEARFLPPLGSQPGSMMLVDRTFSNDNYAYLDFNDSPADAAGPDKPEWRAFVGQYEILWAGEPRSAARIEIRNGWLYYRDGKCREHEPGLFFRYDGETLDLRSDPPSFANLELRKLPGL
jgi:CubicO group peptidase (beta-lactamase class C family)